MIRFGVVCVLAVVLGAGVARGQDATHDAEVFGPNPDDRAPNADDREPNGDERWPDDREPSADERWPTPDGREPSADERWPTPDGREPNGEERRPGRRRDAPASARRSRSVDDTLVSDPHISAGRDSGPERDAQIFGEHVAPEQSLAERIGLRHDMLAIGGQLYSRAEGYARQGAVTTLQSPTLFDTYFDARPTDRVRIYLRARLEHNLNAAPAENATANSNLDSTGTGNGTGLGNEQSVSTINQFAVGGSGTRPFESRVLLDQLWIKTDIDKKVFVTAGRQQVRWGSGRFWNPTDFLNTRFRDPLTLFDERLGVGMVRLHLPVESLGWNFYAIALLDDASSFDRVGGAFRGEFLLGTTEIAIAGALRKGEPEQFGLDITSGIGLIDFRSELAVRHGVQTQFYRAAGPNDTANPFGDVQFSRGNDWLVQAVVGGDLAFNYSDEDSITVGLEAFYNQAGYNDARFLLSELAFGGYVPLYNGKLYGAAYVSLPSPGQWNLSSFTLSVLGNLSDGSYQARLDFSQTVLTYVTLNLYCSTFFGTPGELNLSLHRSFTVPVTNPDGSVTPTQTRLDVGDPIAQFGMALRVSF